MSRPFPQTAMTPVYGVCHYLLGLINDTLFRGEVSGLENLPTDGAFLMAANHASHFDPPFIGAKVPRQVSFFARKTLWSGKFACWWLDAVGTIPVDRDGGQDVGALKRVLRALAAGRVLILFPEGTRSPDGQFQTPKPGVGFIVCKTQVPVVPVRIFGSFAAYGRGAKVPRFGTRVSVVFGRPLAPADYDDPSAGKERYQVASARIMDAVAKLELPTERVI